MSSAAHPSGIGDLVAGRSVAVVAGTGGVGKTTVSAALGIAAAERLDGDVLVLTIDPARRLAAALGIEIAGNEAVRVPVADGSLFAAMLEPGAAWDDLVRTESPDTELAERIIANRVYRRIADTFVHGNDYAALAWLDAALESDRYRLIVVDTPPSQNAVGFFEAPRRVEEFFESSLLRWLTAAESTSVVGTAAATTFASLADRLLGSEFFADVVEFFQLMQGVVPGMVERTSQVANELAGDDAAFIAVTAPSVDLVERLGMLAESLEERGLTFDGIVVNGVEPATYWDPRVIDVATRVVSGERSPFSAANTALLGPGADYVVERGEVAAAQRAALGAVGASSSVTLPRLVHSPSDLEGLRDLGARLWAGVPLDS